MALATARDVTADAPGVEVVDDITNEAHVAGLVVPDTR